MGSLFRSEEMTLCQLFLQSEAAYACVSELGELGLAQFRDLNPDVNAFQRKFVNEVRRCDEMERKLRYLEKEIKKDGIPMLDTGENPEAPQPREMIDLEATFEKLENELREVNQNAEALKRNFLELTELKHILRKTQVFFDEHEGGVNPTESMTRALISDDSIARQTPTGPVQLGFVAGVILRERIPPFERMLWRACRGNVFLRQAEIETPLEDPSNGDQVFKSVFIIFFQGDQLKTRVKKICEGFRATLYPCPEAPADRREMAMGVMTRIEDLNTVLGQTQDHRHRVLVAAAKNIKNWFVKVRKIKAIYHTLNLFNLDVTQKCLIAECWVPVLDLETIQLALRRGTERSGSSVPPILNRMESFEDPPTYNRTNKFTNGFQALIYAYGVASYREVNPVMGSKTPVSILQELCVQRGITPIYTLIYDGGGTHDCYFKYRVHVADFVSAVGSGHSKKEAKHEAAKIALERIKETRTLTDSSTEILLDAPLEQVASPYEGNLHENAVGRLQEICMANNMPLAEYVMVSEEGPPHDKWFVFRCSVSKLAEISGARTKKQAKHLAAFKMVQTLQESLGSSLKDPLSQQGSSKEVALPDDKDTPMSENISKYGEVSGQYYKKVPVSQKISMRYLSLQGYITESLAKLREKFDTGDTDDYTSLKLLFDQTMDELNVTAEWFDLPRECLVETSRLSVELNPRQSELEINGDQISEEFNTQQTQLEINGDKISEVLNPKLSRLEIDSDQISEELNPKLTRLDVNGEQISEELNPKQAGPELNGDREQICYLTILHISTNPELSTTGKGTTLESARQQATMNAIKYLLILTS